MQVKPKRKHTEPDHSTASNEARAPVNEATSSAPKIERYEQTRTPSDRTRRFTELWARRGALVSLGAVTTLPLSGVTQARLSARVEPTTSTVVNTREPVASLRTEHPTNSGATPLGATTAVLKADQLQAAASRFSGAPLIIFDNPESVGFKPADVALVGSTIAPVPGRPGNNVFDAPGRARVYGLTNNQLRKTQRVSTVVYNPNAKEIVLDVKGAVTSKGVTAPPSDISEAYRQDVFSGPHAVHGRNVRDGGPGSVHRTVRIPPGAARVVNEARLLDRKEVFHDLDLHAAGEQPFRVGLALSDASLKDHDLRAMVEGRTPAAGRAADYGHAEGYPSRFGRPNGVLTEGSVVQTGARVDVEVGRRGGLILMPTGATHGGRADNVGRLQHVLQNPAGVGPAGEHLDGHYGLRQKVRLQLNNPSDREVTAEIVVGVPDKGLAPLRPLGGVFTGAARVGGIEPTQNLDLRINARGEGRVVARIAIPPGESRPFSMDLYNPGNTVPPISLEVRGVP